MNLEVQKELLIQYGIDEKFITIKEFGVVVKPLSNFSGKINLYLETGQIKHVGLFKNVHFDCNLYLLTSLNKINKDLFTNSTIDGDLRISASGIEEGCFDGTIINGNLILDNITFLPKNSFNGLMLNGKMYINDVTSVHKNTFNGLYISKYIYSIYLDRDELKYFNSILKRIPKTSDRIISHDYNLSRVFKKYPYNEYTIYETPFGFVAQKSNSSSFSKTIKEAIIGVKFKEYNPNNSKKIKAIS